MNPKGHLLLAELLLLCCVSKVTTISDLLASLPAYFLFNFIYPRSIKIKLNPLCILAEFRI